jgi:hypothetical protein
VQGDESLKAQIEGLDPREGQEIVITRRPVEQGAEKLTYFVAKVAE